MPGYFLNRQDDGQAVCQQVGAANLQVQFDCYHCQIVEGDLAVKLKRDYARASAISRSPACRTATSRTWAN